MWNLSSPTRDRTRVPCILRWILYHWTPREGPSTFTLLYNHHHHPSPELFHLPKMKLQTHSVFTPHLPSPIPPQLGNHLFTFCLCEVACPGPSYKWIIQHLSCVCLISLSVTSPSFIHVLARTLSGPGPGSVSTFWSLTS